MVACVIDNLAHNQMPEMLVFYLLCRDITVNFQHNLVSVDHEKGQATFAKVGADPVEKVTMNVGFSNPAA